MQRDNKGGREGGRAEREGEGKGGMCERELGGGGTCYAVLMMMKVRVTVETILVSLFTQHIHMYLHIIFPCSFNSSTWLNTFMSARQHMNALKTISHHSFLMYCAQDYLTLMDQAKRLDH